MRLYCLGTTGYHPSPSRHTACYYLPDQNIVLDAGTGAFRLTAHLLREPKSSVDILLSHAHLDHTVGLTFLLDVMAVTTLQHIRLHGEESKLEAVRKHLYNSLLFPVPPKFEYCPFDERSGQREINGASVDWFPLEHPGGSLGFVIRDAGKQLAYVTDTISPLDAETIDRVRGVDLLMHECYFGDEHEELAITTGHSWLAAVTSLVEEARPKRTLLIHINPLAEVLGRELQLTELHTRVLQMQIAVDEMELVLD